MDRIYVRTLLTAAGLSLAIPAIAGTVLLPPPQPAQNNVPSEDFPSSRFGFQPERLQTGVHENFASTEVENVDHPDRDEWDGTGPGSGLYRAERGRRPASLEFDEKPTAARRDVAQAGASASSVARYAQATRIDIPEQDSDRMAMRKRGVQEVALIAGDLGFFPKTFFVSRDVPVRMFVTGASKSTLCLMMDSFQVRKQVRSQKIEEITFTPGVPGQYRFYCPVNGMEGTMVVKDLVQ